jgi:hypothetical protein
MQRFLYKNILDLRNSHFNDLKSTKINIGQIQADHNNRKESISDLREVEFQVFSQWGDDGIIQYLINKIDLPNKTFIEFGVEDYREANTRFLLINNNWTGYVIDGSDEHISYIKNDVVSWACELYLESSFITAENIDELLEKPQFDPEVGLLSIDIDGNDYWVWKAITKIRPVIVVAEYNSVFGVNNAWTVPYDPHFVKYEKHASIIYYGASLKALDMVAKEKGYQFIGCNSKGNNAYFIRNDKMIAAIQPKTVEEGYVVSKFREASVDGYRPIGPERVKLLKGLEIFDVEKGQLTKIDPALVKYS